MREKILTFIEKNSRVDLADLAVMLGVEEAAVANEIADMPGGIEIRLAHAQGNGVGHLIYHIKEFTDAGPGN